MWACRLSRRNPSCPVLVYVQVFSSVASFLPNTDGFEGYTVSRAILSDAIALTRGDRWVKAIIRLGTRKWTRVDSSRPTSLHITWQRGALLIVRETLPVLDSAQCSAWVSAQVCSQTQVSISWIYQPLFLRTLPDHFTSDSIYTWWVIRSRPKSQK